MTHRSVPRPARHFPVVVVLSALLAACSPSTSASPSATSAEPTPEPTPRGSPTPVETPAPTGIVSGPTAVALEAAAIGFSTPTAIANAGDGSNRLFVVERGGLIRVVSPNGVVSPTPFLDLSTIVISNNEQGLLGLAFHPDYPENGRFFVAYTRRSDLYDVVAEYHISSDANRGDPTSEITLIAVPDPAQNHNGGGLAFGPDGFLYISMGDGGGQNDQFQNAQNLNSLLGKMLRIDVDGAPAADRAYAIPAGNPFAGGGGAPEIWTVGQRNPWRFSFDRVVGDMYVGDVGSGQWEEIDHQPVGAPGGLNYGWPIMEGRHCLDGSTCSTEGYVLPIAEYGHDQGCAVVGGYVYRGTVQTVMNGAYIFADWCSGRIFTLDVNGEVMTPRTVLQSGLSPSAFGEDEDGELYLVDFNGGGLYRVVLP
ncbi:MAG TPA: PQQ-dependent sugar dehydrogenase [Candidatus Limnocylindria bacterium]